MSLLITGLGFPKGLNPKPLDLHSQTSKDPSSIESLRHPHMDDNQIFNDLKRRLSKYYEESSSLLTNHNKWDSVFYLSLHGLLREVVYTKERDLQLKLLNKVSK